MNNIQNRDFSNKITQMQKKSIIQNTQSLKITNKSIFFNKTIFATNNPNQSQKISKTTVAITYQRITSEKSLDVKNSTMNLSSQQLKKIIDFAIKNAVTKTIAKFISRFSDLFEFSGPSGQTKQNEQQNLSNSTKIATKTLMNDSKK